MANKDLEKGKQLLKDQVEEVGVLDNAFKSLSAVITTALEDAADSLSGIDTSFFKSPIKIFRKRCYPSNENK